MSDKFSTKDGLLTIDRNFIGDKSTIRVQAAAGRITFCSNLDLLTVIDDMESDLTQISFTNGASTTVNLKDSEEAKQIAEFLGLDIYQYAENGNDYEKKPPIIPGLKFNSFTALLANINQVDLSSFSVKTSLILAEYIHKYGFNKDLFRQDILETEAKTGNIMPAWETEYDEFTSKLENGLFDYSFSEIELACYIGFGMEWQFCDDAEESQSNDERLKQFSTNLDQADYESLLVEFEAFSASIKKIMSRPSHMKWY